MANILTIEVGAAEIRVAEMKDEKKGSSIRRCFRFPVSQGLVEDGLIQDVQELGEQLKNELLARKISARKVRFIVASSRIASREIRIPFIKKNRIQDLIEMNAADYFPIDPAEYIISYRIIDVEEEGEEKEKEKKYHLMVYACPKIWLSHMGSLQRQQACFYPAWHRLVTVFTWQCALLMQWGHICLSKSKKMRCLFQSFVTENCVCREISVTVLVGQSRQCRCFLCLENVFLMRKHLLL